MKAQSYIFSVLLFLNFEKSFALGNTQIKDSHSGCWRVMAGIAGYFGIGPLAFQPNDPRWEGLNPDLKSLLRHYSTFSSGSFGGILELSTGLKKWGPWEDQGLMPRIGIHVDPVTANHVFRPGGSGWVSARRRIESSSGFPANAKMSFSKLTGLGSIDFYLDSRSHQEALADLYGFWIAELGVNDLAMLTLEISKVYSAVQNSDLTMLRITISSATQLGKWLELLEKSPEYPSPLAPTILQVIQKVFEADKGGIVQKLILPEETAIAEHLKQFYIDSVETLNLHREVKRQLR